MKPTHYMFMIGHMSQTKNKLEKSVLDFITSIDRSLIQASEVEKFKDDFVKKIEDLNKEHPRCRPIEITFNHGFNKEDIMFYGIGYYQNEPVVLRAAFKK